MCNCFAKVNKKLVGYNGILEFNFLALPPRTMVSLCKVQPRGKKPPLMEATYCPFCGEKYKERGLAHIGRAASMTAGEGQGT